MNEVITKNPCETFVKEMEEIGVTSPAELLHLLTTELIVKETKRVEDFFGQRGKTEPEYDGTEDYKTQAHFNVIKCFLSGTIDEMRSWLQKPKFKFVGEGMPELGTSIEEHLDDWLDVARRESTIIGK